MGRSNSISSATAWCDFCMRSSPPTAVWSGSMVVMSPPAQKCLPAPASTMALMLRSALIAASAASTSPRIAWLSALRASGRFSRMVATPSSTVYWMNW